jgi:hypothetical protein
MEILPSKFQEYSFTPEELIAAKALSHTTRCYLQNELSNAMLRKVALVYDHSSVSDWELFHAELDGRISVLVELLDIPPVHPTKAKES